MSGLSVYLLGETISGFKLLTHEVKLGNTKLNWNLHIFFFFICQHNEFSSKNSIFRRLHIFVVVISVSNLVSCLFISLALFALRVKCHGYFLATKSLCGISTSNCYKYFKLFLSFQSSCASAFDSKFNLWHASITQIIGNVFFRCHFLHIWA